MANITKTAGTQLIPLTEMTMSPRVVIGTSADVSTKLSGTFFARIGRTIATAFSNPAVIRIEALAASTDVDTHWFPIHQFGSSTVAASDEPFYADRTSTNTTTNISVASLTGFAQGDLLYIKNTSVSTNAEWHRCVTANGSTITVEHNLQKSQYATVSVIYDQADIFAPVTKDLSSIKKIRAVVDGSATNVSFAAEVLMVTGDSIG